MQKSRFKSDFKFLEIFYDHVMAYYDMVCCDMIWYGMVYVPCALQLCAYGHSTFNI